MSDPIVFVPGLLCTKALYAPQIAVFAQHSDCIVADHTRHDSMAAIADSILADTPSRFRLVGLSMGGFISLEIMDQAPGRVASLALLDTNARSEIPAQTEFRRGLMAKARSDGIEAVLDPLLPRFVDKSRLDDTDLRETIRQMFVDTGTDAFIRQQTAIIGRKDRRTNLPRITCPTLVVVGANDALTPPDLSEEIAAAIPGAKLEVIQEAGHLTTLERPEAVNDVLAAFWGEQS